MANAWHYLLTGSLRSISSDYFPPHFDSSRVKDEHKWVTHMPWTYFLWLIKIFMMSKTRRRSVKHPSVLYCGIIILGSKPLLFYMLSCLSICVIECLWRRYAAGKDSVNLDLHSTYKDLSVTWSYFCPIFLSFALNRKTTCEKGMVSKASVGLR